MKSIFLDLLGVAEDHGNITEANMYESGYFSNVKFVTESGTYTISVSKEKKNEGEENDA